MRGLSTQSCLGLQQDGVTWREYGQPPSPPPQFQTGPSSPTLTVKRREQRTLELTPPAELWG